MTQRDSLSPSKIPMIDDLQRIIDSYNPDSSLDRAYTIPASWYVNEDLYDLELRTVFTDNWHLAGRRDQLQKPGQYVTADVGAEPIVVVRDGDGVLRGVFNVCRHHAAAVMTEPEGSAPHLRCPYHGWTYSLAGELKGTPDFAGVCEFERENNGLVPVQVAEWENWVFVDLSRAAKPLDQFLGSNLIEQVRPLQLHNLHWLERRHYSFDCNWKVFVDNYLDRKSTRLNSS